MTDTSIKLFLVFLALAGFATAQRIFIHQQEVKLTIPISTSTFFWLDSYSIFKVTFTDLQGSKGDQYEFSFVDRPEILTIHKQTGEIFFHRGLDRGQKVVESIAEVMNTRTKSVAKTHLEFNIVKLSAEQFCLEKSCFYDHIRILTAELDGRKSNNDQLVGDVLRPPLNRRLCNSYKFLYLFENGTDFVSLTRKDQLAKSRKMNFETLENPNIVINMTCEIKSQNFSQDFVTNWKLLNITVIDRNDNWLFVDELSKKVDIFYSKWDYKKGDRVNIHTPVVFHDSDSLEANRNVEIRMIDKNFLFHHVCQPTSWLDPDTNHTSSAYQCYIYFTHDGILVSSTCFQLKAFDGNNKKNAQATSNICVHPAAQSKLSTFGLDFPQIANIALDSDTEDATGVHSIPLQNFDQFKCGGACLTLLIGLPCLAIFMTVIVSLTQRKFHQRFTSLEQFIPTIQPTSSVLLNEKPSGRPDFYSRRWEVDIKDVEVGDNIGEGEFGVVMKASLKSQAVVIKTVKDVNNDSEIASLKTEFEQLQKVSIDGHENVIKLMGSYSKGDTPLIFLQFCLFESLKNYLLASRLIENRNNSEDVDKITSSEILQFSLQIAQGMEYLSSKKLVHRDLAARNVLLAEGKICKISDFGLTRKVCNSCEVYSKSSNDKVPLKWMSPESLSSAEEYTTKSDVWSFGILGYELVLLGTSPYPELTLTNYKDFYGRLKEGYRMKRPTNCSADLFKIFESCWNLNPANRPTFQKLANSIQQLTTTETELWTTPEFTVSDCQEFDVPYYEDYIKRVRQTRAASTEKLKSKSLLEISKSLPKCNAFVSRLQRTVSFKASLSCSNVGASLDNPGYDGSFDSIQSMKIRQHKRKFSELESTPENEFSATSSSPLQGYCHMNAKGSFDTISIPSFLQPSQSTDITYFPYFPMELFTGTRTRSSSSNEDTPV